MDGVRALAVSFVVALLQLQPNSTLTAAPALLVARGLQATNSTAAEVPSIFTGIVSFPYLVLFWAAVLGVWSFYLLALSGSTLAGVVCRLANALVLRRAGCELHIGSLSLSLLGGRVFFSDLRYATRDVAVVVLRGSVVIRWWTSSRKLRDGFHNPAGLPCRLEVSLAGLHVALLNRAWTYDEMEAAAKRAAAGADAANEAAPGGAGDDGAGDAGGDHTHAPFGAAAGAWHVSAPAAPDPSDIPLLRHVLPPLLRPLFYRIFPTVAIDVTSGHVAMGAH